jgi:serine/threonine-protein kinase HipA
MSLHLVGETLDKARSHYLAESGKLVQLMRGIYADAGDDLDAVVLAHAVRIAHYLYPKAYLSGASASLLGPTRDGRLFVSARRKQRTRIRSLEIIQNEAPKHPSVNPAVVGDDMGEIRMNVSSIRQRFLEAFRLRSEHAASIDGDMREAFAARLVEEYGTPAAAAEALWSLARENAWYREGELAERFLLRASPAPSRNASTLDLIVAWHRAPIGRLVHDGFEWRWTPTADGLPPLVRQTTPGKLPPFILSLLPEGWLEKVLDDKDERAALQSGKRYMSNITIVGREGELSKLPQDVLTTTLDMHAAEGRFTGTYAGPGRGDIEEGFERNLARIFASAETPRLSGVQIKAPMFLDGDGRLVPATAKPFTHILKPAGTGGFEDLPVVEWMAMTLGREAGLFAPAAALVAMPDGMPPALVVERFDIRRGADDGRMLALEDFCSVLDVPTDAKYDGTMERVARAVRPLSTSPDDDMLTVLNRALFAWLIADGDMHLKNLALLKTAERGEGRFHTVRMAPLYDAVTTRVFPGLKHDRMALKLGGKDDQLKRTNFRALAAIAGLRAAAADAAIDGMLARLGRAADRAALPKHPGYGAAAAATVDEMLALCRKRIGQFE